MKQKIWNFLEHPKTTPAHLTRAFLIAIVIFSIVYPFLDFFSLTVGSNFYEDHRWIEWAILTVFGVEYSFRVFSAPSKRDFIFSFNGIVDLISFAPFIVLLSMDLEFQTYGLRLLRFLRISQALRLLKYSNMRIRTKIFIAFLVATLMILVPTLYYVYNYFTELKEKDIRSALLGYVVVASEQFYAEDILSIKGEDDPQYKKVQEQLIHTRDDLQAMGIEVRYIYMNKKDPNDPTKLIYIVDAELGEKHSLYGDTYDTVAMKSPWSTDFSKPQTAPDFDYDDDGKTLVLTAWAPLPTRGKWEEPPVVISMDILAEDLDSAKQSIGILVILILGGSIIIISMISIAFSTYFNRPIREIVKGIEAFEKQDFDYQVNIISQDELGRVGDLFNTKLFHIMKDFYQFMYAPVAKMLTGPDRQALMEGKYEHVSVLYTDFKSFTSKSSLYSPRQVVDYLNKSFAVMEKTVSEHNGIIDKHIGDALMVYFLPEPGETNTAQRAVKCALAMQSSYTDLYEELDKAGSLACLLRIGINSGDVILGAIGSEKLEVTVIGNTVNLANRVESAAKPGGIGVSPATATQSRVHYWLEEEYPEWKISEESVDVKHLENFPVIQIFKNK